MQLSRIRKWSVMLLVVCSIVSLFAGCGKKTPESTADPAVNQSESTPPEEEIEDTTTLSEINTDFGTLYIPQKYEQLLKTEVDNDTVKFLSLIHISGAETKTYQYTQSDSDVTAHEIPITAAKLHNADGSYADTKDKNSGTCLLYTSNRGFDSKGPCPHCLRRNSQYCICR